MISPVRLTQGGAVLAAVKDASRRLRRWPLKSAAILDRGQHRARGKSGRDGKTARQPNQKTWGLVAGAWHPGVRCAYRGTPQFEGNTVRYVSERTSRMSPAQTLDRAMTMGEGLVDSIDFGRRLSPPECPLQLAPGGQARHKPSVRRQYIQPASGQSR